LTIFVAIIYYAVFLNFSVYSLGRVFLAYRRMRTPRLPNTARDNIFAQKSSKLDSLVWHLKLYA